MLVIEMLITDMWNNYMVYDTYKETVNKDLLILIYADTRININFKPSYKRLYNYDINDPRYYSDTHRLEPSIFYDDLVV